MINKFTSSLFIAAALVLVAGCGKHETATTPTMSQETAAIDTASIEKQFQSAPPEVKTELDQAIAAIKSGNVKDALDKLQALGENAKLAPEQKQAARDLWSKVQEAVTRGANKAVEGAEKALDDVKDSIPK